METFLAILIVGIIVTITMGKFIIWLLKSSPVHPDEDAKEDEWKEFLHF